MSFSSDIKAELARQQSKARHCQIAELAAMIMQEGRISMYPYSLSFETENPMLLEKYAILRAFGSTDIILDAALCHRTVLMFRRVC